MDKERGKLVIGGLLLIASLFLSTRYSDVPDIVAVNHPYDLEPYSLKSYWYQLSLHFMPFVYVVVFGVMRSDWGFVKWMYLAVHLSIIIDFYLGYNDFLLDMDVVNMVMIPVIIVYMIFKKL